MDDAKNSSVGVFSIVVDGVSKTYGDFRALKAINFRIRPGEIVGFLGPNGAGKSTTMKILTCFMAATQGRASVAGFDVHTQSQQVRRRVGYLPENVPLYDEMLVFDYLKFIAEIRQIPRPDRRKRIDEAVERTGLGSMVHREIRELSKGYRQRVGLAQAIIHQPDVLILDEPTTGLDPNQIIEIRDVIKEIGREKTIVFSTHIMQEVTAVCDRIIIIHQGEIVADGTLRDLEDAVAQTEPGLLVEFAREHPASAGAPADPQALRAHLAELPGVHRVKEVAGALDNLSFRLLTAQPDRVRTALFQAEVAQPRGLLSLTRAEPTLEEIFRVYTAGATEESAPLG